MVLSIVESENLLFHRDSNTQLFRVNNGLSGFGGAEISAVWPTLSEDVQLAILELVGLIR
jgi:hypothetical protein